MGKTYNINKCFLLPYGLLNQVFKAKKVYGDVKIYLLRLFNVPSVLNICSLIATSSDHVYLLSIKIYFFTV
jgi:hypothetical protein